MSFRHIALPLSLMAPAAVAASQNIPPLPEPIVEFESVSLDSVSSLAKPESFSQFQDIQPSDWAYQALANLFQRYGCISGFPEDAFRGSIAISRFEAAALLRACLNRVDVVTDELKLLVSEFHQELALTQARVDSLEPKLEALAATQFSPTTTLKGLATMVLGGNAFYGSNGSFQTLPSGQRIAAGGGYKQAAELLQGEITFNYDIKLTFNTSFTGKDALVTVLRAGNFQNSGFGGTYGVYDDQQRFVGLNQLQVQFQEPAVQNSVAVNRLYYQFPIGQQFVATIGGVVRQDDMLALWPSVYSNNAILNYFSFAGAPGAYNLNLGPGVGLWWKKDKLAASLNYIANTGMDSAEGMFPPNSSQSLTFQLSYQDPDRGWGLAAAYSNSSGNLIGAIASGTPATLNPKIMRTFQNWSRKSFNSFTLGGYWQPSSPGWIPSLSVGWGYNQATPNDNQVTALGELGDIYSMSWSVGLVWENVFLKGNSAGMAFGQPTFITSSKLGNAAPSAGDLTSSYPSDSNWAFEWWYRFQLTDNISITPAIFYLTRPLGQITNNVGPEWYNHKSFSNLGALLMTTFRF